MVWEWLDGEGASILAKAFDLDEDHVRRVVTLSGPPVPAPTRNAADPGASRSSRTEEEEDTVRPVHYGGEVNPFEAIKVIEFYNLNFALGNALKYILRKDFKGTPVEDLRKAAWYCNREADRLEGK